MKNNENRGERTFTFDKLKKYEQYLEEYDIIYKDVPGKKKPQATRIYVGVRYGFKASPSELRKTRTFFLMCMLVTLVTILVPLMTVNSFARVWYVLVPACATLIAWYFAMCATWQLCRAKDWVTRETHGLLEVRMIYATAIMMILSALEIAGCIAALFLLEPVGMDYIVCAASVCSFALSLLLFSKRGEIEMIEVENPNKPRREQEAVEPAGK